MKRFFCLIVAVILMFSAVPSLAYEDLSMGSKGDAVSELQNKLNELGYSVGVVDGDFGGKTENAIKAFQKDHGIFRPLCQSCDFKDYCRLQPSGSRAGAN